MVIRLHYKILNMDISKFNNLFGIDITKPKCKRSVRAKQAVMRLMLCNDYSRTEIALIFGCSRQNVTKGTDKFLEYLKEKEYIAVECWNMVKDLEI